MKKIAIIIALTCLSVTATSSAQPISFSQEIGFGEFKPWEEFDGRPSDFRKYDGDVSLLWNDLSQYDQGFSDFGNTTVDHLSNLEWLDLGLTAGRSGCDVQADMADSSTYLCDAKGDGVNVVDDGFNMFTASDNWRVAEYNEVFTLFDNWFKQYDFTTAIYKGAQTSQTTPINPVGTAAGMLGMFSKYFGGGQVSDDPTEVGYVGGIVNTNNNGVDGLLSREQRSLSIFNRLDFVTDGSETAWLSIHRSSSLVDSALFQPIDGVWLVRDFDAMNAGFNSEAMSVNTPATISLIALGLCGLISMRKQFKNK